MKRIPRHIGIIPDGNRRWAQQRGMGKEMGYDAGIDPGLQLFKLCLDEGVQEITYYGFTTDNTKRPTKQRESFTKACIDAVKVLKDQDAALLVVGNASSPMFPAELLEYTTRRVFGKGTIKVNFLVNYSWKWDVGKLAGDPDTADVMSGIHSSDISRVDLVVRWGGRRRLSGFLPLQAVYSDFYVIDEFWPDFKSEHFYKALDWYGAQDITLGG